MVIAGTMNDSWAVSDPAERKSGNYVKRDLVAKKLSADKHRPSSMPNTSEGRGRAQSRES